MEVGIHVLAGSPYLYIFSVVVIVSESAHGVYRQIAAEILIAGDSIVGP